MPVVQVWNTHIKVLRGEEREGMACNIRHAKGAGSNMKLHNNKLSLPGFFIIQLLWMPTS
jgi:hypothetical protein